eukprot:CAMPEP_0171456384 /NCGR_PEP_ID=MMETSP0945-20130129/2890_1 /TAXON_ID=109269 /ORGANISM="Vaucheria litorea, Strain CCMP2940" /LENGTH=98 /DNA_ID=CAMNT_0011981793 /DNA_START=73 /DNA_END=369 /DNA_ORIENTATION=-
MTWKEIENFTGRRESSFNETNQARRREIKVAVIPIGSTEQHGPTGLIGTDYITAEAIAKEACAQTDSILLPTLPYGMSMHHTGFPGTFSLKPNKLFHI